MIDLEKTANHRVYKTDLLGSALVVTLQGDSPGFSIGAVHNEMATLIGLARNPEVQNLVIDLSGSNYYGSLILGEIVNLGQAVREHGGRIALAGISSDMKEILRMMRLDGMWERYPTRSMALRALANIPWQIRWQPYIKPAAIAGGVLLLIALFFLIPRKDYTAEYYRDTVAIWEEAQQKQAAKLDDTEWQVYLRRADRKLEELKQRLVRIAGSHNPAAQNVLYAVRDYAPKALEKRLDPHEPATIFVNYHLTVADAILHNRDYPPRPQQLDALGPDPTAAAGKDAPTGPAQ